MYKAAILEKKRKVYELRRSDAQEDPHADVLCADCGKPGHYSKNYYKCELYVDESATQVGTKRKKQTEDTKKEKMIAKKQKAGIDNSSAECKSCHQVGHSTANSPLCPNHIKPKKEYVQDILGPHTTMFTRKIPFDKCVRDDIDKNSFQKKIRDTCEDVRSLVFRMKLFVNYYIIKTSQVPAELFNRQFWYTTHQLIMGKTPTKTKNSASPIFPESFIPTWEEFCQKYPNAKFNGKLTAGASQCITEVCVELATSYTNCVVETFENKLLNYLKYKLHNWIPLLENKDAWSITKSYLYQHVCGGTPQLPRNVQETSALSTFIKEICEPLKKKIGREVSLYSLSEDRVYFLKILLHIQADLEKEYNYPFHVRRLPLPRLWSPLPSCSYRWRSITINANVLSAFVFQKTVPKGYEDILKMYRQAFNIPRCLKINNDSHEKKVVFNNLVRSDGFSVDFVFVKKKFPASKDSRLMNSDLLLQDFDFDEVKSDYNPISIDPGRKSVFTAALGIDENVQIRRCTTKEYYHNTGSTTFSIKMNIEKSKAGIDLVESRIPSYKTSDFSKYEAHTEYILSQMNTLFAFYDSTTAQLRFNLYQGKQRAEDNMVNMLIHGTSKYNRKKRNKKKRKKRRKEKKKTKEKKKKDNEGSGDPSGEKKSDKWKPSAFKYDRAKIPLIVFGAGMFGKDLVKLKGNRCGVTGVLFRSLKKREITGDLIVVTIDEYKTSKTCSLCFDDNVSVISKSGFRGVGVVECSKCRKLLKRDNNAAINMMTISKEIWSGRERPAVFQPKKKEPEKSN